jgi:hypothetical protein
MKKTAFCLMILLSTSYLTGCTLLVHHADPFYELNDKDFPRNHLPLINPIEATSKNSSSPWSVSLLPNGPYASEPNSQEYYGYYRIEELEKFAVKNGVIMAYSSYVDKQADAYIQDNYYHWFVIIPNKKEGVVGFHTEYKFDQYIQTLGIQNPDWQTPDAAFDKFAETGCLDWIPDCNQ